MKKTWLGACAALAFAFQANAAVAQTFVMRLSSPTVNDVTQEWMKAFKAGVEGRAGGKMKVEIYPANQLGQIPATVEGVALGTIEFTVPAVGFFVGLEPRFQVLDAPGLFTDMSHAQRVFTDPEVRKRLATFGQSKGVEPLIVFAHSPLSVVSHKPIHTVAEFRAQKLRMPGGAPIQVDPFRKIGVSAVSMPLGETLPAMQNRSIDGAVMAVSVLAAFRYYDVAKTMTKLPGGLLIAAGVVNRDFMKSLGPELEKIVREEAMKAETVFSTWGVADAEKALDVWKTNGGTILQLSDEATYVKETSSAVAPLLAANARLKEDYEALRAAAERLRQ